MGCDFCSYGITLYCMRPTSNRVSDSIFGKGVCELIEDFSWLFIWKMGFEKEILILKHISELWKEYRESQVGI